MTLSWASMSMMSTSLLRLHFLIFPFTELVVGNVWKGVMVRDSLATSRIPTCGAREEVTAQVVFGAVLIQQPGSAYTCLAMPMRYCSHLQTSLY